VERIAVVGCGGAGKSTLARQLATVLGAPLTHLDEIYYDRDWNPLPHHEFDSRQREIVAAPRWVIDGNYATTLPLRLAAADTVIFLDLPPVVCLWGVGRRWWRYRAGRHRDAGAFNRIRWSFLRYIWRFRRDTAPRVRSLIAQYGAHAHVVTLTSRRQARQFAVRLAP
jgi:adenylate kinase family enzyme